MFKILRYRLEVGVGWGRGNCSGSRPSEIHFPLKVLIFFSNFHVSQEEVCLQDRNAYLSCVNMSGLS